MRTSARGPWGAGWPSVAIVVFTLGVVTGVPGARFGGSFGAGPSLASRVGAQQPASDAGCADPARVRRGVQLVLRALREVHPAAARGCEQHVLCGTEAPAVDRSRCTVELAPEEWGYRARVRPRPSNGVPDEFAANVSVADGTTHQAYTSGSVWAVGRGVAVVGLTQQRRHTHGGAPARIAHARFRAWNDGPAPLPLALVGGDFVRNGNPRPLGNASLDVTSLPPGESEFEVRFDVQDAYQSWNDYFGVAVRLRAGEQALAPQAAWRVTRVTPLRH